MRARARVRVRVRVCVCGGGVSEWVWYAKRGSVTDLISLI